MKKFLAALLALVAAFAFMACNITGLTNGEALDYDATKIKDNIEQLLSEDGFMVELAVSFADTGEESVEETIVYAQKGDVMYVSAVGKEMIVDFSDEGQAVSYLKEGDSPWIKHVDVYDETVTREMIEQNFEEYSSVIFGYFGMYSDFAGMLMEKTATTVAGRDCDKFTVSVGVLEYGIAYTFSIDKQTGMCLEWQLSADVGEEGSAALTFSCTKFETPYAIEIPTDAIDGDFDWDEESIPLPEN
ncbi:MAG: hypothetical protein IKC36_05490 [Clostridia bacterium]|nr:hypothetical protein [Clostridia bacterium]